jgi:hypothetical protein
MPVAGAVHSIKSGHQTWVFCAYQPTFNWLHINWIRKTFQVAAGQETHPGRPLASWRFTGWKNGLFSALGP